MTTTIIPFLTSKSGRIYCFQYRSSDSWNLGLFVVFCYVLKENIFADEGPSAIYIQVSLHAHSTFSLQ